MTLTFTGSFDVPCLYHVIWPLNKFVKARERLCKRRKKKLEEEKEEEEEEEEEENREKKEKKKLLIYLLYLLHVFNFYV